MQLPKAEWVPDKECFAVVVTEGDAKKESYAAMGLLQGSSTSTSARPHPCRAFVSKDCMSRLLVSTTLTLIAGTALPAWDAGSGAPAPQFAKC